MKKIVKKFQRCSWRRQLKNMLMGLLMYIPWFYVHCINGKYLKVAAISTETAAQCITDVQETKNSWMWNTIRILDHFIAQRCSWV